MYSTKAEYKKVQQWFFKTTMTENLVLFQHSHRLADNEFIDQKPE